MIGRSQKDELRFHQTIGSLISYPFISFPSDSNSIQLTDTAELNDVKKRNGSSNTSQDDPKTFGEKVKAIVKRDLLMLLIIVAVIIGFAVGIGINSSVQKLEEPTKTTVLIVLGFLGELLMNMLKMLILPLIVSSLIVGLAALDQQSSGRMGARTVGYYMATTLLAVILGIILVLIIQPGSKATQPDQKQKQRDVIALDSFLDLLRYVVINMRLFKSDNFLHRYV